MNTFFRIAIWFTMVMLMFTLVLNFIDSLGAFPVDSVPGQQGLDEGNILEKLTGLSNPTMGGIFLIVTSIGGIAAVGTAVLTHQVSPIGVYLFSVVFWTSYIRINSVLSAGGFIPVEILTIGFVGIMFIFIAAVIGMLTGSG